MIRYRDSQYSQPTHPFGYADWPPAATRWVSRLSIAALLAGAWCPTLEAILHGEDHGAARGFIRASAPQAADVPHMPEPGPYDPGPSFQYTSIQASRPSLASWPHASQHAAPRSGGSGFSSNL
jgi:hypothetical protein